jgi:hypothetical protein
MPRPRWEAIHWLAPDRFRLDDVTFWLTTTDFQTPSTPDQFVFLKNRQHLHDYETLLTDRCTRHLLELGIYHGAGLAFWDLLLKPDRSVGIDRLPEAPILAHYMITHPTHTIVPHFGVAQEDQAALQALLLDAFPAQDLDVVIDDASHEYVPTRAALAAILPFVRPGGLYIIEDWAWAHWPGVWQDPATSPLAGRPLSNLVFELVMIAATSPHVIQALHLTHQIVVVERGPGQLAPTHLALETLWRARGGTLGLL